MIETTSVSISASQKATLARLLLVLLFLCSGISKLISMRTGAPLGGTLLGSIATSHPFLYYFLIFSEFGLAVALSVRRTESYALFVAICFLSAMTGLLVFDLLQSRPLPCGCVGVNIYEAAKTNIHKVRIDIGISILRNVIFILIGIFAISEIVRRRMM
jgi:hypothetical protein